MCIYIYIYIQMVFIYVNAHTRFQIKVIEPHKHNSSHASMPCVPALVLSLEAFLNIAALLFCMGKRILIEHCYDNHCSSLFQIADAGRTIMGLTYFGFMKLFKTCTCALYDRHRHIHANPSKPQYMHFVPWCHSKTHF